MFRRLPIVAERPHLGPLKTLESAQSSFLRQGNGQLILTISHETIRGVTPEMLKWWFEHLSDAMTYDGKLYPRYLLWHPRDHIHWELVRRSPTGESGAGAYFRIVEAFGANPEHYIDAVEYVEKLDTEGISLVRTIAGVEVFSLEHRFGRSDGGASYKTRMVVGADAGLPGRVLNDVVRPMLLSDAAARAWLTHNVEEVGMFEYILPPFFQTSLNVL
jgi:hypothetical protein